MAINEIDKLIFIGRKTEQKAFRQILTSFTKRQGKHVVLISGPGGYGKTTLTSKLGQIAIEDYSLPLVKIDWDEDVGTIKTVADVMKKLALEFVEKFHCKFDTFFNALEADRAGREESALVSNQEQTFSILTNVLTPQAGQEENRIKTLSISFLKDLNTELSSKSLIVCFDTYERIDLHRQGGDPQNFCDKWVQRLIKESSNNILFLVSGREDHSTAYKSVLGEDIVDSFSLTKFGILDVSDYVKQYLGVKNTILSKKIYNLSGGIPLLTLLCVETLREFPDESFEDIFGSGDQTSAKTREIFKVGAIRFLRYLQKQSDLLLLTQLAAITQIDSNSQEQRRIVTLALDRAHVTTTVGGSLITNAARSFSSIFIEPARLHPEIREVVVDDLIANESDVIEGALRTAIEQAERVLSDLLELHNERVTLTEDPLEQNNLQAQYVNIYAWIDPQRSLNIFLKECLERAANSFKRVESYLSLLTETRLQRIFPDITKDTYQQLLKDITRPTFLRFLKTFPLSRVDSQLKTLFEIVRLNLELIVSGSTKESAEALIKQGKVIQKLNRLLELISNNDSSPEAIYEVTGLAEAYISFAQILNNRERFEEEFNTLKIAVKLYEKLSLSSSNRKLNYLHLRLAKTAVILEDTSAAQTYAKKALELLPEDNLTIQFNEQLPDLIQSQASRLNAKAFNLLRRSSKVDAEVITKIEEAIELDPENVEIYNRAIRAYRRNRQYAEALRASHKLIELHPLHISGLTGRGEVFYELGYFPEAVQTFTDAMNIATQKGNEEALNIYTNLGRCCVMQGKYEDAIIYFDKRINGGLKKLEYLRGRPSLTASDRKFNEKQRNYLKHVYNRKAFALLKLRYVVEARELFEEALSIDSNYHESWIGLSLIEMAQNNEHLWQGVRACRENIKINPSKISNYYHQAILHLLINTFSPKEHLNNFRKALSETREAFGFIHEAIFLLNLIREHVKAKHVDANLINEIVSMLEAHLQSTPGIPKDFPHTVGELVDTEPHVRDWAGAKCRVVAHDRTAMLHTAIAPREPAGAPSRHKGTTMTFPNGYALVIGIANYLRVRKLPSTVLKDARDVKRILCSPSHCGYPENNVRLLLDSEATAEGIRAGLRWLSEVSDVGDTAVLFFSGHGGRSKNKEEMVNYLIPYDCDPDNLGGTAISGDELTDLLRAVEAQRLLALFDSCYSGGTGEAKDFESVGLKSGLSEEYYGHLAQGTGRVVVASSRSDEVSLVLGDMDNSLFTHYLLEALRGSARTRADGLIRVFDLFDYVSEKVPVRGRQHPIFKAADLENNFPVALYAGGKQVAPSSPATEPPSTQVNKRQLREAIDKYFTLEDLEILCDDIKQDLADAGLQSDISLEQLGEGRKSVKVLRLIDYLDKRGQLSYLVTAVRRARPGII